MDVYYRHMNYCSVKVLYSNNQPKFDALMSNPDTCRRTRASIFCLCSNSCHSIGLASFPLSRLRFQQRIGFGSVMEGSRPLALQNNFMLNCKITGSVKTRCGESSFGSENEENSFYMRRALALAKEAFGFTSPNPMVGCVLVKDGQIVGEGFHPKAGQPHAEVFALRNSGESAAEGATAYVTLEPCNHFGRTPPCTEALIKAKVKKVVVGMVDPNPIVAFKGVERLKQEGIEVVVGVEEASCRKLLESYTHKMLTGKPFLTLRYSMSVNGTHLDELGEAVTETGGYYSQLLQEYDAVIHSATSLSNELELPSSREAKANQPLHVVVADTHPDSPLSIPSLSSQERIVLFTGKEHAVQNSTTDNGMETVGSSGHISLNDILDYCSKQGLCNVLLDLRGGVSDGLAEILKEGFDDKLVQKVIIEVLPIWANSRENQHRFPCGVSERLKVLNLQTRTVGRSVLLEGYL